jgi:hypothetical protein
MAPVRGARVANLGRNERLDIRLIAHNRAKVVGGKMAIWDRVAELRTMLPVCETPSRGAPQPA